MFQLPNLRYHFFVCKQSFSRTQPCLIIDVFSMAAFAMVTEVGMSDRDYVVPKLQIVYHLIPCDIE